MCQKTQTILEKQYSGQKGTNGTFFFHLKPTHLPLQLLFLLVTHPK